MLQPERFCVFGSSDRNEAAVTSTSGDLHVRMVAVFCNVLDSSQIAGMYHSWDKLQWVHVPRQVGEAQYSAEESDVFTALQRMGHQQEEIEAAFAAGHVQSVVAALQWLNDPNNQDRGDGAIRLDRYDSERDGRPVSLMRQMS
eukprot:TRINITY_DN24749_c0_g1_i1.p2 TRINITY_DN24749_c0_g1~~TRINITY_DN24749_c0_g1_i1.p2  ORF type:complete len:143 (-),score=26.27 TRINITY_DN24749_c0_g1_i1:419-847(-)